MLDVEEYLDEFIDGFFLNMDDDPLLVSRLLLLKRKSQMWKNMTFYIIFMEPYNLVYHLIRILLEGNLMSIV